MKGLSFFGKQSKSVSWESSLGILFASLVGGIGAYADVPTGIIGGQVNDDSAYGAFVFSPSGSLSPISGLPANTNIGSVGINTSGAAIIGGQTNSSIPYAALVSASGAVTPLALVASGNVLDVAINESGHGLLAEVDSGLNQRYAVQVSPDGTINAVSTGIDNDNYFSIALNNAGIGLIGGEGSAIPYAAYLAADGTLTLTPNISTDIGHLNTVAINSSGVGIIAGITGSGTYAAFVVVDGVTPVTIAPTPPNGNLASVAINDSGLGLIGGQDEVSQAYAAYAATDGTATPLFDSPFGGNIQTVALNSAGTGLIGGDAGSNIYGAIVQPNGMVTPLFTELVSGGLNSVSINDAGVGLIGGIKDSLAYAALVAPNGSLTELDVSGENGINSVAISSGLADAATPTSAGPLSSAMYTQLAAISALQYRFIEKNKLWQAANASGQGNVAYNDMNLLVSNDPNTLGANSSKQSSKNNSIWVAPFGNLVYLKAQGSTPKYSNEVAGILVGYDYTGSNYLVGGTLGYAFNYIGYSNSTGHGKINEEMANVYGAYYRDHFWVDAAVWGGYYQFSNKRNTLSLITSKGKTHGWILSPHLEMASPWAMDQEKRYYIEPFFTLDWVNNWMHHYTESGSSGFNLKMKDLYNSLLQSEVGLRFYEKFTYGWGSFNLEEKASYVNQAPFHFNSTTTSFVASASSFPIAVGSSKVQNLATVELMGSFVPKDSSYPYGGFDVQVTANGSYQSYFFSVFTGKDF